MRKLSRMLAAGLLVSVGVLSAGARAAEKHHWEPAGWGGGGFFYSCAFDPKNENVIYLGGDVNGAYKSVDGGKSWKIINNGISAYGVFSLAVDPSSPNTVWAATDDGLSKSTDGGETWKTIEKSGPKDLRLTGEKNRSTHSVAVHPTDGKTVFVGTPHGKVYKTTDGGESWTAAYTGAKLTDETPSAVIQFGRVNGAVFGGMWTPLKVPADIESPTGIGFTLKVESGAAPRDGYFTVKTSDGIGYRSRNLHDDVAVGDWRDITLAPGDFIVDPMFASKQPEQAKAASPTPDLSKVERFDLAFVNGDEGAPLRARIGQVFLATGDKKVTILDIGASTKGISTYGNFSVGKPVDAPVFSVAINPKDPNQIAAASGDKGLLLSNDGGATWEEGVGSTKRVAAIAFAASDENVIYVAAMGDGVFKSTDKGKTWSSLPTGLGTKSDVRDIVVSPKNADHVRAIVAESWSGSFIASDDGGKTWRSAKTLKPDPVHNPTLPDEMKGGSVAISAIRNLALNPNKPDQLFIAGNWRNMISDDAGKTWTETANGADISCVADIRFHDGVVYACAMDEGVLASRDNGKTWQQLWPLRHSNELSGHYWRLDVREVDGKVRIVSTSSPWDRQYNQVVTSNDGGKTFAAARSGLPDYLPTANTMWGRSYARALAVDPNDPNVVYVGLDGDPTPGKSGGGVFKSTDGGKTFAQLPGQPGSRRMFFGLAVDPTNSKRIYWSGCGDKGGLYRSDDGGESWEHVFSQESWIFNLHVSAYGTVYALGKKAYRSTDHGKTWQPLAGLPGNTQGTIVGFETHPTDKNTLWAASATWGNSAPAGTGVFKTTDGGKTWTDITGDLPYRRPLVLRFNAATNELWAGYVGIYKIKQ